MHSTEEWCQQCGAKVEVIEFEYSDSRYCGNRGHSL